MASGTIILPRYHPDYCICSLSSGSNKPWTLITVSAVIPYFRMPHRVTFISGMLLGSEISFFLRTGFQRPPTLYNVFLKNKNSVFAFFILFTLVNFIIVDSILN